MNRKEEYWELMAQLNQPPSQLNGCVTRAVKRAKRRRWRRPASALGSLAGVCAAFVLMVNASPAFALSCGSIPVLKEIAAAVAFSPSLKSAIQHDYIQYVGQRQTVDGVTVTLESVIADAQQMVVFYRADYPTDNGQAWHAASCDLTDLEGQGLKDYGVTSGSSQSQLNTFEIHFSRSAPPQQMILKLNLHIDDKDGQRLSSTTFSFPLRLDGEKTAQKREIAVGRWIELDGQRLFVDRLELTPTKTALILDDDPDNTAWLSHLDFFFTDKHGVRYDQTDSSVGAMGREASPGFYTYYHQSLYFLDDLEGLTLHISGADWLDKERRTAHIDLTSGRADWLPDYILEFQVMDQRYVEEGAQKTLRFASSSQRMCLDYTYFDPEGGEHSFSGGMYSQAYTDDQGVYRPYRFEYMLKDYPFDQVAVTFSYTHVSRPDAPLAIPVS